MTIAEARPPIPSHRNDFWHYAPLDELTERVARSVAPSGGVPTLVSPSLIDAMTCGPGPRLVFVNGVPVAGLSTLENLPDGVRCGIAGADQIERTHAAALTVDDGLRFAEPIQLVHLTAPDEAGTHLVQSRARTTIELGDDAQLNVVEIHGSVDGPMSSTLTKASTTIRLGERAELAHHRLQSDAPGATHVGHTDIRQGPASVLRMTSVTVGGDITRNAIEVHLGAPDARTELMGIDVAVDDQRHDTVVSVQHGASRCASSQRFTGVVDDRSRGSFSGEIIVAPGTVGTDAHQSSRNLVLDPNAEADTRPWLRILADDVRCTHGATVGRLDDDALHYLRSRGIPISTARSMLIDAFLHDITDSIKHEMVRLHVEAMVASATSGAAAHGADSVPPGLDP